jgi:hypothetical protein
MPHNAHATLPISESAVTSLEGITSRTHAVHSAFINIHSSNMMSCGEVSEGTLRGDTAEKLIWDATRQFNNSREKLLRPLNHFREARTAMLNSTTVADLTAHYTEAVLHLKTVTDNLNEYVRLNNSLDVDALFAMARQSEEYRGLTDEQLKAGIVKRVAKVRYHVPLYVEDCNVVNRKNELKWRATCRVDYLRHRARRARAFGHE